ncbi:interferon alpha-inducible protein 27-like protein 2A [Larus michahellis]|uniref:interferon alpha-inducible protein 27-like protein 2A n=1 Tax=Larus michahellis TaxID=119627 RepID=UPI003D9AF623
MLQAPADEPEESCGKVKASGEAACSCRLSPLPPAEPAAGRCHLQDRPGSERTPHTSRSSAARPGQPTMDFLGIVMGATAGLGLAAVGVPMAVGALGFTAAGITAGSVAAKMMSAAAIANGGGVAAGSTVAVLQSIGAAGVPTAVQAALTAVGAATGAARF